MFCKHCGSQIADNTKFCPICGKPTGTLTPPTGTVILDVTSQSRYNIGNYIVWIGCGISFISLFLTFASVTVPMMTATVKKPVRLLDVPKVWIPLLILFIAIATMNFFKLHIGNIIGSAIGVAALIWVLIIKDSIGILSAFVEYGAGHHLLFIGILITLAGSITGFCIYKKEEKPAVY